MPGRLGPPLLPLTGSRVMSGAGSVCPLEGAVEMNPLKSMLTPRDIWACGFPRSFERHYGVLRFVYSATLSG